jgi:hypothetical protein
MKSPAANQCVERMGTSRSGQLQLCHQWRLVPTAHARLWEATQLA